MACPICADDGRLCAECGHRPPERPRYQPVPGLAGFVTHDRQQPWWDALAEDMRNPCLEDR